MAIPSPCPLLADGRSVGATSLARARARSRLRAGEHDRPSHPPAPGGVPPPTSSVRVSLLECRNRRARAEKRKLKAIDWIALKLEEEAEELINAVISKAKAGDWRAAAWLYDRTYGRPQERVEMTESLMNKDPLDMTPDELDQALAQFIQDEEQRRQGAGEA
jgi:hypothetical protein